MSCNAVFGPWRVESGGPFASADLIHQGNPDLVLIRSQSHHMCLL